MFADTEYLFSPRPFWFASEELLTNVMTAEINAVTQLFARYPDIRNLFDTPEATVPQRIACFALLAHRKLMEIIYETFASRYEQSPSHGDTESNALSSTHNLVAADAPAWVLELNEVAERLPSYIHNSLPEPLRVGGYDSNNSAQVATIESAAKTLSSVEQIRALTEGVIDEQLRRLERRWSAIPTTIVRVREPNKRGPNKRKGWEQREKLYRAIREVLTRNPSLQGMKFCAELDKRHAPPLYDWMKLGQWRDGLTWKEAWNNPDLLPKIRRVRQEAMKNR
jgi:hypothetical protein